MTSRMLGRGVVALVAATLLLDGIFQLQLPGFPAETLTTAGLIPDASLPVLLAVLGGVALLMVHEVAPVGALSTTAMLGYRIGQGAAASIQLGCVILGLAMWLGIALHHPAVGALFHRRGRPDPSVRSSQARPGRKPGGSGMSVGDAHQE
ncbi:hypothetical protein [Sphingomonas sp.]|uniref:hypothetical protein n=1 Tax=Sphingomonas sp. TaxID=28214 RepID=UPI003B3BD74D